MTFRLVVKNLWNSGSKLIIYFFLPQTRESYLKCRRVEKDVGGLCDVCGVHTVVVRNVLKNIIKMEGNDGGCCKRRQQHCTLLRNGLPNEVGLE